MVADHKAEILITGAGGYIGSVMVRKAIEAGFKIRALDNRSLQNNKSENVFSHPLVECIEGTISNESFIEKATKGIDCIIHLAGVSDGAAGKKDPELTKIVNIDSLLKLLLISKNNGVKKFLFASTMGVYGNQYNVLLQEDLSLKPIDPYSISKAIGEELVRKEQNESFSSISLRLAMVYGLSPAMKEHFIVNRLTIDAIEKNQITILGGDQKRPQIHIDDLCRLFLELASSNNRTVFNQAYNAVCSNPSLKEIFLKIKNQLPDTTVDIKPGRENEDSFEMDGNKLKHAINFHFKKNIDIGVRELIDHYSKQNHSK